MDELLFILVIQKDVKLSHIYQLIYKFIYSVIVDIVDLIAGFINLYLDNWSQCLQKSTIG